MKLAGFWGMAWALLITGYLSLALHNSVLPKVYGVAGIIFLVWAFWLYHMEKGEFRPDPKCRAVNEWCWFTLLVFPYPFLFYYQEWGMLVVFVLVSFGWLYVGGKLIKSQIKNPKSKQGGFGMK